MRPVGCALVALVLALAAPGCREDRQATPAGCREGAAAVRSALHDAPGRVTLDGTSLSACIGDGSDGGSLRDVGQAYVSVATELADRSAGDPNGRAAIELGYLVGAMRRGATGAQGVGYELGRRIDAELTRVDTGSAAFRRGLRAGRDSG